MPETAVVLGSTGLIGQSVVEHLIATDDIKEIVTLTRRPVSHSSEKVINHVVDFEHLENHASGFEGDVFFSCLGTTVKQAGSRAAQRKVDVDYQFKAAQLASKIGVPHYLLVSSYGANPKSPNQYLKMKGELEQKIRALPFDRISIFQPSLLVGKRDDSRLGEEFAGVVMPVVCSLPWLRKYRPINGNEVASSMVKASQEAGESFETFKLDEIFVD